LTALYINTLLEAFDKTMGIFVADEQVSFRPAGTGRFARNRSGHLDNDLASEIGQRFELDPYETLRLFVEPKGDIRKAEFTDGDEEPGWEAVALEHAPSVESSSQDSSV
jgi:hypothetical protein